MINMIEIKNKITVVHLLDIIDLITNGAQQSAVLRYIIENISANNDPDDPVKEIKNAMSILYDLILPMIQEISDQKKKYKTSSDVFTGEPE